MKQNIRNALAALSLGAIVVSGAPALADPGNGKGHGRNDERHGGKHDRGNHRNDRHDDRKHGRYDNRHDDRGRDRHYDNGRRPVVYHYDYNRPDPRYRGYYAERYYRGGYEPMRVTRQTRIYRGHDNRYYCRRNDGTTGLIVGAAVGGLLGNSLKGGSSGLAATLIGAGAGGLLGREIDRGGVSCR